MRWVKRNWNDLTVNFVAGLLLMGVAAAASAGGLIAWSIVIDLPTPAIVAVGIGAFAGVALLLNQGLGIARKLREKSAPWASAAQLSQPYISRFSLRLVDLVNDGQIKGRTFEDCTIYGPAMMYTTGTGILTACSFDAPPDAVFVAVAEGQTMLAGPITLVDCVFRRCDFRRVGIIGPKKIIDHWKATQ